MNTLSKYITKTGKISKTHHYSIEHCLKSNKIQLSSSYQEYNSNPYQLFYTINNLQDVLKVFQFSFTINYFNLTINQSTSLKAIPSLNLIFYDDIGDDILQSNSNNYLNSSSNQSVIIKNNSTSNFNLIIGNSRDAIVDSLLKIIYLTENFTATDTLNIGLFLGQVNPNKYLNRSFKLHRLKDLYTTFFKTFNTYKNTSRLYLELTKSLLSLTIETDNINFNYSKNIYSKKHLNKDLIKYSIILDRYLASYKSLVHRVNIDILDTNNSIIPYLNKECIQELYNKTFKDTNNIIYVTPHTLLLTKKGAESCEKLIKSNNLALINKDKWCHIKLGEEKESSLVYLIFFTDGTSIEVLENSKFILESGEVKSLETLVKNDKLKVANFKDIASQLDISEESYYFPCNGIVDQVLFDRAEYKLVKITIPANINTNYLNLANGIHITPTFYEKKELTEQQLNLRLSDYYTESTSLVQDSIILESSVNLDELDIFNIEEQLKIFKTATLISGTSLNLKEHKLCKRLQDNIEFNPTINVSVNSIQKFYHKLLYFTKYNNQYLEINDHPHKILQNQLILHNIPYININNRTIRLTKFNKNTSKELLKIFTTIWRNEIYSVISEYCTKHNINIPHKITSVSESYYHKDYNVIEQLDLILIFHKYYSTQNSIMTINYYKSELNKLVNKVTSLYKSEVDMPYLLFNQLD